MTAAGPALLDRHPGLPVALLVLLAVVSHLPACVLPVHNDPLQLFGALTGGATHGWLPGRPFLDPYIAFTTDSISRLAARDWLAGQVPWWNPYTGIGLPLAGQMQPAALFLPFILLLALPAGVVLLMIAMQVVAGLGTYALLRQLRRSQLAALAGGALFMLNGTIAWIPGPAAVVCSLAFLPLLLWGIERARVPGRAAGALAGIAIGIGWSLLGGFPETAYLDGLLALAWAGYRLAAAGAGRWRFAALVAAGGVLGVLLASPLLIAFAAELAGSTLPAAHLLGTAFLPSRSLSMLLLPAVYGPSNNGGVAGGFWGSVGGYGGVLILFLALLSCAAGTPDRGLRRLLLGAALLTLAKTYGFAPAVALLNALPLLKQVAFDRYAAPVWEFSLTILAAYGLDAAAPARARHGALLTVLALLAIAIGIARPHADAHWCSLSAGFALALLAAASVLWRNPARLAVLAVLAVLEALVMFWLPQCAGQVGGWLDLSPVRYLQAHAGLGRVATLGPLAPNYGSRFGVAQLNHNMSPVPQSWLDHIDTQLLPGFARVDGGVTFWPVKTPPLDASSAREALFTHRDAWRDVGLRYVLTAPGTPLLPSAHLPEPAGARTPHPLPAGQGLGALLVAPPLAAPIQALGVMLATYGATADGTLTVRLCAGATCRTGRRRLAEAADNALFYIPLQTHLAAAPGKPLTVWLDRTGGSRPVALWRYAGPIPWYLDLDDGTDAGFARRVFAGRAADIWELANVAAYFEAPGCTLEIRSRIELRADCPVPTILLRRELFMPGWTARIGNTRQDARPRGVLQQWALPAGRSDIGFAYAPPHVAIGWAAALIAALILILVPAGSSLARKTKASPSPP